MATRTRELRRAQPPLRQSPARADIQGLRAVAVILVILGHAGSAWFPGGYIGVDVFFVISGFLITGILARSFRRTGRVPIGEFYARRARRILPASAVALVGICVTSASVYSSGRLEQVLDDTLWAAIFGANLHYGSAGTGYFDNDDFVSPVQHFWSLAVEEQFYLAWPLLLAGCGLLATAVLRRHGPVRAERARSVGLRYGVLMVAVICVASVLWSMHRTETAPTAAYFSTFGRAHELGIGALLALTAAAWERLPAAARAACSWIGLGAIGIAATQFSETTAFPGVAALLPVLGAALVLAGGLGGPSYGAGALLSLWPMRRIGDISFSLYLWHWPCLILPAAYLGRELQTGERLTAIAVAFLIAGLSYRFVEQPYRRPRVLSLHRLHPLVLWPVCLVLVLGSSGAVRAEQEWRDAQLPAYTLPAVDPEPATQQTSQDSLVNDVAFAAELTRANHPLPARLQPELARLRADVTPLSGYQNDDDGCFAEKPEVSSKVCTTGDGDGDRTVVALGDSHMGMWLAPITEIAEKHQARVVPLLKGRCMPFGILQFEPDLGRPYRECLEHTRWAMQKVRALNPDLVVVSALYLTSVVDPTTGKVTEAARGDRMFATAARRTLRQLRTMAPRVLVIGPTPVLPEPSATCLGSRRATMGACRQPLDDAVRVRDRLLGKAARDAGAEYLRMIPWFCDAKHTCPIVIRNRIVYRDPTHVTETYAEHLKPVFAAALKL